MTRELADKLAIAVHEGTTAGTLRWEPSRLPGQYETVVEDLIVVAAPESDGQHCLQLYDADRQWAATIHAANLSPSLLVGSLALSNDQLMHGIFEQAREQGQQLDETVARAVDWIRERLPSTS